MEDQENNVFNALAEFAAAYPEDTLPLIAGLFVALLERSVKEEGGDPDREIRICSDGRRDIVICAKSNAD